MLIWVHGDHTGYWGQDSHLDFKQLLSSEDTLRHLVSLNVLTNLKHQVSLNLIVNPKHKVSFDLIVNPDTKLAITS